MVAYFIADQQEVTDHELMKTYSGKVTETIEQYGGTKIVRSSIIKVIEGNWDPERMTIIAFPDMESLKNWYESDEYADLKVMRQAVMASNAMAVEGL